MINLSLGSAALILLGISIIQFLLAIWIKARLNESIRNEYEKIIEDYKYELKTKEKAEIVAEYLSLFIHKSKNYQRLNQLSMELALWLPADLYKRLGQAMLNFSKGNHNKENIIEVLMEIRKNILKDSGDLTDADIIVHKKDTIITLAQSS